MIVYATGRPGGHFHTSPECVRLRAGQARNDVSCQVVELSLDQLDRRTPCKECYPDAPRVKVMLPYCHQCESPRPCEHNGGIAVKVPSTYVNGYALIEPGETIYRTCYVRPDRAYLYELAEPMTGVAGYEMAGP